MKDVAEIRRALQKLPHALKDDIPPNPPRFRGVARQVTRADLCEIDEGDGHDAPNPRIDVRDLDSLLRDLDESVGQQGIEALAWYHPFHVSANKWGIYIPVTSVHYGAERWFNRRIRRSRRASMALEVLLAHEVMHHACEYAVAQFELLLRAPCWAPARERLKQVRLGWFNDEEALANAHSIRKLGATEPPAIVESLHRALLRSPPGYRDFPAALSDDGFQDHLSEVLRHNVGIPAVWRQFLDRNIVVPILAEPPDAAIEALGREALALVDRKLANPIEAIDLTVLNEPLAAYQEAMRAQEDYNSAVAGANAAIRK